MLKMNRVRSKMICILNFHIIFAALDCAECKETGIPYPGKYKLGYCLLSCANF
jgi:hypothetical protein